MTKHVLFTTVVFLAAIAPTNHVVGADPPSPAKPALATRDDAAMRRWRANRFGLFIHWGLYAVAGGQWQGKEIPARRSGFKPMPTSPRRNMPSWRSSSIQRSTILKRGRA